MIFGLIRGEQIRTIFSINSTFLMLETQNLNFRSSSKAVLRRQKKLFNARFCFRQANLQKFPSQFETVFGLICLLTFSLDPEIQ